MLLLIATANIHYWLPVAAADSAQMNVVDRWVTLMRIPLADQAAYPLFSILLGFGIAVMARRFLAQGRESGLETTEVQRRAVRQLRLRGGLLLCFGAVLGVFFTAEILGTYGLVTVLIASLVVREQRRGMIALAAVVLVFNTAAMLWAGQLGNPAGLTTGVDPTSTTVGHLVLGNVSVWLLNTVFAVPLSLVVPATLIGVWLARTDLMSHPERHRRLLLGLTLIGAAAAAGAVPFSLYVAGFTTELHPCALATLAGGGLFTGIGWLAIIALISSLQGFTHSRIAVTLSILGRNSLTGYIGQILLMAGFMVLTILGGSWPQMSATDGVLIAVLIWTLTLILCDGLHVMGRDRPAERLLRLTMSRLT